MPVAGRSRDGTCAFRANAQTGAIKAANGTAPGGDRMDMHHRGTEPDSGHLSLQPTFELSRKVSHISRRPAHIERDDALKT